MNNNQNTRRKAMEARRSREVRALTLAIAVVLIIGAVSLGTLGVRIHRQAAELRSVEADVERLQANADNLDHCAAMHHNLDEIRARATAMGMQEAGDGQVRLVTLPQLPGSDGVQTVANPENNHG